MGLFHLGTKCQLITRTYKDQHNPVSTILSTFKWRQAPPNSSRVDLWSVLKYTKLFFAMCPTALATSLPRQSQAHRSLPFTELWLLVIFPASVSWECHYNSRSQPYVLPQCFQISLKTVSSMRAGSLLSCSPFYPEILTGVCASLSALLPSLSIFSSSLWGESIELYFPEDFSLTCFRLNSASGDTYVIFKRQMKRNYTLQDSFKQAAQITGDCFL